jgi:hypothetical protein
MIATRSARVATLSCLLACVVTLFGADAARAQVAKQGNDVLSSLAFQSERLAVSEPIASLDDFQAAVSTATQNGWAMFRLTTPVEWRAGIDQRTGMIAIAEGGGIAWIPGRGNSLSNADIAGLKEGAKIDLTLMETLARKFLPQVASLLGVDPASLVLNPGRSGQPGPHVWFVDFDVVREGLAIEGARVVFRVNNGNLVQFGTENLPAPGRAVPKTVLTRDQALNVVARFVGGLSLDDQLLDAGSLHLLPANVADSKFGDGFAFGNGRDLAKIWQVTFHRDGVMGTWRARVDATTGELLSFADVNDYAIAQVNGGVFPFSPTVGPEVVRAMPFANVSSGGFANSGGLYNFPGGTVTSTLAGQFVRIADTCGAISQASDASGAILFGTSAGTDCTTPGHGGAGNTHSSRTQFYHVNRIKEVGRGWLPANAWLGQQLLVNVNLNQTCNAYWNGSSLNFFRSGGGCGNTGEIAAVSLHEYGHGLDQNDGTGTAPEGGTGESYGDLTAAIQLHNSCIGPGFLGGNCGGYGDACTACTGVRDLDFAKHVSNTPATVANFTQVHCGFGSGPCGREVHCESYVPSEAVWDFANRDLPNPGSGTAWTILDRLWYLSRNTATSSFACTTGGTFTSNGCNTGSWWKTMRAVDDDDGNLSNGTPHSCNLFAAFNRHGIACTTDAGANTCFAGCTAPPAPAMTLTPGDNSVAVAVSGTGVFDIFRNEIGCNAGFIKVANDFAGGTFNDTAVANGTTYSYQAVAQPSGNESCASVPATCLTATPSSGPCTPPAAPTGLTATAGAGSVALAWNPVSGASEYHVLRSTTSGGPYSQIGTSTTTSFTDSAVTGGTTYFYVVRAANSPTCESGNSNQASATPTGTPDFSLSISPPSVTVGRGNSTAIYTVTVTRINGFSAAVNLSVSGLPTGTTGSFSPNPVTGTSSTLTLSVTSATPKGTFTFTVTGTGGSPTLTRTATAQLIKNRPH